MKVPCSAAPGLEGRRDCSGAWLGWLGELVEVDSQDGCQASASKPAPAATQPRGRRPKAAALWQGRAGLDRTGYLAARTSPQPGSGWQLGSGECGESGQWWCVRWYPAGRPAPADTQAARKTGTRPAAVVTGAAPGGNPAPAGARAHTSQGANNLSRGAAQRRSGGAPEQRYLGRALVVVVCFAGISEWVRCRLHDGKRYCGADKRRERSWSALSAWRLAHLCIVSPKYGRLSPAAK